MDRGKELGATGAASDCTYAMTMQITGNSDELAAALGRLAQQRLVAIRDPHRLDKHIAACQSWFSARFDCPVTTNLYTNSAGAAGFIEHHDAHDVFALQLAGSKRWLVGPPLLDFPSHRYRWRDTTVSSLEGLREFIVQAGQCLYIPLGWRHKAQPLTTATDGSSVCI